jgi:uncharacterized protein YndB with AHSA1/START domain
VTPEPHGTAVIEFPNELSILITREFEAPIALVFDVFTKPEHVRNHFPPFGEEMAVCEIDLRVGGSYRYVMVTQDGTEMSFRGTYLEIEPPTRSVQTWIFDGWPEVEAVETMDLHEADGVTTLTLLLAFGDQAGRDHMTKYDGIEASFDNVERYLRSLLDREGRVSA